MSRLARPWPLIFALSVLVLSPQAVGQSQSTQRGPRFILAAWTPGDELDASDAPVLRRRVSVNLTEGTIGEALRELTRQAKLEISYSPRVVPLDRPLSLHVQGITVAAALTEILLDVPVDVSVTRSGGLALVRRAQPPDKPAAPDTGAVAGQVHDSATRSPLAGATVTIEGTRHATVTDAGGRYRIGGLPPGLYTVRARFIGYAPLASSVAVNAAEEIRIDFSLARSAQPLEQVVVTGTVLPTEVKALPTPVTIVTGSDIERQHPRTTLEILRQSMPGTVAWDQGTQPQQTTLSVRGASSLNPGSGTLKVYLDGIEVVDRTNAVIDPNSIGRIEVTRGPQAAAIYGSDAIGGVLQVFTKRGDPSQTRPEVNAEVRLGMIESPYDGYSRALRQDYSGSVLGGTSDVTYSAGGGYTHSGDWVPEGRSSTASGYGAIGLGQGPLTVDLTGRYYQQRTAAANDPRLGKAWSFFASPFYREYLYQEQTYGARLRYAPSPRWQHSLTVGVDRLNTDAHQTQPRLTTEADTLLFLLERDRSKASFRYNTSLAIPLAPGLSTSVTGGVDHYTLRSSQYLATGALNTTGTIRTAEGQPPQTARDVTNNTGYFSQLQVNVREALFLTAGIRLEDNSNFGSDVGTPLSAQMGASYVHSTGATNIKVRASYGQAIHPPDPGQREAVIYATNQQLANPLLGPERQAGWDAGVDVVFGARGSLSVTYFNQIARDLIALVFLGSANQNFQFQNVGRVKNTGLEVEASLQLTGALAVKAQYAYTRSRAQELGANYSGDLRIGEQVFAVPHHTGGASVAVTPWRRVSLNLGVSYVGSWTNYDYYALFSCFGGTAPCRASNRDYLKEYPGFAKVDLTVGHEVTSMISAYAAVSNLTNSEASEFGNFNPVIGRIASLGVRVRY